MKKVISMHIGGVLFNTEDSAYTLLERYFAAVEAELIKQNDVDDTLLDIQYRVAEHLNEKRNYSLDAVILESQVLEIVEVMGAPKNFSSKAPVQEVEMATSDPEPEQRASSASAEDLKLILPGRKRLYRDTDDRIVAGVCSGLSYYLGISDPMWMRIIFVLMSIGSGGGMIALYILLWIVSPKAETEQEKMMMQSGHVEMGNVRDWIDRELTTLRNGFEGFGDNFRR